MGLPFFASQYLLRSAEYVTLLNVLILFRGEIMAATTKPTLQDLKDATDPKDIKELSDRAASDKAPAQFVGDLNSYNKPVALNIALRSHAEMGHVEAVEALVKSGANPNDRAVFDDETALHKAAKGGKEQVADVLLKAGANPTIENIDKMTPADLADKAGHKGLATNLQTKANMVKAVNQVQTAVNKERIQEAKDAKQETKQNPNPNKPKGFSR